MAAPPPHWLDTIDRLAARRPMRAALLLLALAAVYLQAHFFLLAQSHEVDSYSYWFAARAVSLGQDPYDGRVLQQLGEGHDLRLLPHESSQPVVYPYVYPPPFAGLWRVFLGMSPVRVHHLLEVSGTLMLGLAMVLLHRLVRPSRHGGLLFAAFALGLAVNGPAVSSTRLGQMNAPLLVGMLTAALGYRGRPRLGTSFSLAAATLVKLTPGLLLVTWSFTDAGGRWRREVWLVLVSLAAIVLVSFPWAPPVHWVHFVEAVRRGIPWQTEYSWWGWLTVNGAHSPGLLRWRVPLYLAGAVPLVACAFLHLRRTPREYHAAEGAAAGVVLGLLLWVLTWQHHFLLFMLPAYLWISRAWHEQRRVLTMTLVLLTALVLLRLPGEWLWIRPLATLTAFLLVCAQSWRAPPRREPASR